MEETFLARWSDLTKEDSLDLNLTSARGPFSFSSSWRPRNWRSGEVRLEIVLDGRLNDCLMFSKFMDDWVASDGKPMDRNLALFKTFRVSAWSNTESSWSLSTSSSFESNNNDLSCNSWLLNLMQGCKTFFRIVYEQKLHLVGNLYQLPTTQGLDPE